MEMDYWLGFMPDIPSQLSEASQGWAFLVALVKIDDQQQVSDESSKQLEQDAVLVSGDEMIDFEMPFPPGEEGFNLPPQREDEGDLLSREIRSVGCDPVGFAPAFEADQIDGVSHLVALVTQQDFGEEEDSGAFSSTV